MLTDEQIKWVASVFKEAGAILDKISDFPSNDCHREECLNNILYDISGGHEFFFVEDIGLYKLIDHERGQLYRPELGLHSSDRGSHRRRRLC